MIQPDSAEAVVDDSAIEVEGLFKHFGNVKAVNGVSFKVPKGEFFGFLGPNGAGKSTTIKVLCGLIPAQYKRIQIAGFDLASQLLCVKANIGVMLEEPMLYDRLSAKEHLTMTGQLYGLSLSDTYSRSERLLSLLDLSGDADRLIVDYSQGMRKKTALACAMIHDPDVLFLDEPFNGIDTLSARQIKDMLVKRVESGKTIMFSSHVMEVVEKLCTSLAIIHRGQIVYYDSMDNLRSSTGFTALEDTFLRAIGGELDEVPKESQWLD
jgi:ABC-2 type transport system ATP-binding protein